jgi:hypothetical protein
LCPCFCFCCCCWLCFALLSFALLCLQFQTHFIKRRSRGVMVSTQMDLTSPLFSSRVGVMQPSLGTMSTFLGGWLHCFLPALSRFRRLSSLTSFHEMSTKWWVWKFEGKGRKCLNCHA